MGSEKFKQQFKQKASRVYSSLFCPSLLRFIMLLAVSLLSIAFFNINLKTRTLQMSFVTNFAQRFFMRSKSSGYI